LKTFKYTCHDKSFFWFEILHKCENKYEKGVIDHFLNRKKSLNYQKSENHVATFPY